VLARLAPVVAMLAAGTSLAVEPPLAVPLDVREVAGVARQAFPARASVPLPRGRVRDARTLWLASPSQRPALLQSRVLERWPDGSVRWLLLDFVADVPAGAHATYTLRAGTPATPVKMPGVEMRVRDGTRVLASGALRVTVPGGGKPMLAELSTGSHALAAPVALPTLVVDGLPGGPPRPGPTTVETEGPVRTELLLTGHYPQGIRYEARLAVFAGQPLVRVQLTITNVADQPYARLRALTLALPGEFTSGALGVDGSTRVLSSLAPRRELRHLDAAPATLDGKRAGRHADGWAAASGGGITALLAVPDFWQQYPKAFRFESNRLLVDLFAAADDPIPFGSGAAKTHEVWIALTPAAPPARSAALAAASAAPLEALPPAAWIVASGALPQAIAPDTPAAREFLARLSTAFGHYQQRVATERWDDGPPVPCSERPVEHPRTGLYGALNWGDWQFPGYRDRVRGCDGWGNLEYDLPQVLGLAYAATGSRLFFDGLMPAARHYRDVDIIHHFPGHPERKGMNHPHKALHFAVEAPETVDLGHTWTEGLITLYRLTGEVRALQAAVGIADAIARGAPHARNPRQFGWPMLALTSVYDATARTPYLDAARSYADAALTAFPPTPAAGDWKMGILADGLAAVHADTGDERLRRWLVAYADALVAEPGRYPDPRYSLPLGYLAALTHEPRYTTRALATVRGLKLGEWGKPLAAMGRTGFRLLGPLARVRTADPSPPPPATKPGAPRPFFQEPPPTFAPTPDRAAPRPGSRGARPPR